jgi:hypothetical protein
MQTKNKGNRLPIALAAAIMMVMPTTIGYYLVNAGFGYLDMPPIFIFISGCVIAMGGSAILSWVVYKLAMNIKTKFAVFLGFVLAVTAITFGGITLATGNGVVIPALTIIIGFAALVVLWWGHGKRRT